MAAHQVPPSLGFSRQEHGVGCHFLLQGVKVKSESEVAHSCPTLSDPMDCSLPGSSVHGIFQARVLEWGFSQFSSVHSVVSDSLQPHELQHARPPCPSPTPGVYWNSCPSSWWCHPASSSSVAPFSSCPQSLPASGSFPMSQLFAWGGRLSISKNLVVVAVFKWSVPTCR